MAEQIKRAYDIIVLKVQVGSPRGTEREPQVHFTLQYHDESALIDGSAWDFPMFAVAPRPPDRSTSRGVGPEVKLPHSMLDDLRDWFDGRPVRPLWVHLVKPYGMLRLVPWERALGEELGVPILMLPDFIFPPPREAMDMLDVVLCGSAPLGYESHTVMQAMRQAADNILSAGVARQRLRLHVFADRDIADMLSNEWQSDGRLGHSIVVHGHEHAAPFVSEDLSSRLVDKAGSLRSPWLLWMRAALAGRAVDVVHFVCHGHLTRERGAMLFAQSPLERTERYLAGPVGSAELGTFLTQVGAWSTVFTSLPDNHSDPGLRWLADEIAQSRPGPMMMHTMRHDPGGGALREGYGFLYSVIPQPPPRSSALFVYCQPYLTLDAAQVGSPRTRGKGAGGLAPSGPAEIPLAVVARNPLQQETVMRASLEDSPLDRFFGRGDTVSSLVASTERFAEQVQLRCQEMARDETVAAGAGKAADIQATFDTLDKLRAAVADLAARKTSGGPA